MVSTNDVFLYQFGIISFITWIGVITFSLNNIKVDLEVLIPNSNKEFQILPAMRSSIILHMKIIPI